MKNKDLNVLQDKINSIKTLVGGKNNLIIKDFIVCKKSNMEAALLYINGLANNETIDRDILKPLMFYIEEDLSSTNNLDEILCKKYISLSNTSLEQDINQAVFHLKRGKAVLIVENSTKFIILDTAGGEYRDISDPINETSIRASREGFVEKLETNISILRRRIKDNNLVQENLVIGRRNQTDVVEANLFEGKIAIIAEGTPFVMAAPAVFFEFFQAIEDYTQRTIISSFTRLLRYFAVFIVTTLPAIYITLIKFNSELIPFKFVGALIESRKGIALTPFMSILSMNIIIDFLREGGLRLPFKIAQTLSVVGGIIIGDAAIKAKIVSSTTLLVVGISTVATFLIPNYEMAISIRLISYPMLFLGNFLGMFGITIGWFFLIAHLCTLESYGVPYFKIYKSDLKDIFVRGPIYKMNKRPEIIPNSNPTRQSNFRDLFRRKDNGE
ncbi:MULTISPECIES: spore germination protein [Clostridium]|uniref:Spore germination protein n=6 Tax=Clostridium TaxID=1485 RepID=A0A7X5SXN7_CLOSG|nr:spore germination protein [Clostridium sporogenes]AJD30056.1 GerA spore germination family protein [Clostridium botulinum Prevot_594]KOY66937.1 spore germination protein [Clostridium sporogenes]KRU37411.1 spore germination protein [Clostridium sporogenes]KYN78830.1 spore germination protein [Clostridium sporogenes]MBW5456645.1 spore germination protein [Clostridium sporogenes]